MVGHAQWNKVVDLRPKKLKSSMHCALAARLLDDLHVHDHILHEMGLLGADSSEVLHGPRLARAT